MRFLKRNLDVFAWSACEAPGVDPEFISYSLNVNSKAVPRKQQPQRFSKEHAEAVKEEVWKLKQAVLSKRFSTPNG